MNDFLYILQNGTTNQFKIGITNNIDNRIASLQTGCPFELHLIKKWTHHNRKNILNYEKIIHQYFTKAGKRIRNNGEWFFLNLADVDFLCQPQSIEEQDKMLIQMQEKIKINNFLKSY